MHIFKRVKFRTPESIELEFTLAGIGNRAWALLIDYQVLGLTIALFVVVWTTLSVQLTDFWISIFGTQTTLWLLAIAFFALFAIYTGYFVFFEALWQGQTPGKRVAKIRVIRDDGKPIGLPQATLRALLRPVDEILFIGVFLIMLGNKEKRLGDLVAGTIVIQNQLPIASTTIVISEQAKAFSSELIEIVDLSPMLPDDFAVISEYLRRRVAMLPRAKKDLSFKLANQVKEIIHLENIPQNINSDVFFRSYLFCLSTKNGEWRG
ncbi:MAG: RDD family protein [Richelia sp. SM2_1_7]|nr:RDD family protein [Richelia sp. SM2_1_7]